MSLCPSLRNGVDLKLDSKKIRGSISHLFKVEKICIGIVEDSYLKDHQQKILAIFLSLIRIF